MWQIYTYKKEIYTHTTTVRSVPSRVSAAFEKPLEDEATTKGVKRSPQQSATRPERKNKAYTGQQQKRYLKLKFHLRLQEVYKSVKYIYLWFIGHTEPVEGR